MNANYLNNPRHEMASFLPRQASRVLEIGCSDGAFAAQFPPDVEYWGIDPAMSGSRPSKRPFHRFFGETYDDCRTRLPEAYFDLVVCNDVIEHMRDHDGFLRDIRRVMKPGSRMVGSVPNVGHIGVLYRLIVRRDWRYEDQGILDRTHLRFFTRRSLARSLREAGFQVVSLHGINSELRRGGAGRRALIVLAVLLSAGLLRDSRYIQFGFCVRT